MIVLSNFNCARSALRKKIGIFKAIWGKPMGNRAKNGILSFSRFWLTIRPQPTFGEFLVTNKTPEKTFGRFELKGGGFNSNTPVVGYE